ncbi:MAG: hypothetical protein WC734_04375 [Patescibacteria group bacterium]
MSYATSVGDYNKAYVAAQNDHERLLALTKIGEIIEYSSDLIDFHNRMGYLYELGQVNDRLLTLQRHIIENNPHFKVCWDAFRALPDSLQQHYLPRMIDSANCFEDGQSIYEWASDRHRTEVMRMAMDTMIRTNQSNVGREWLVNHLPPGSASWTQNVNEILDGKWWKCFCEAYNNSSAIGRHFYEEVARHHPDVDWVQCYALFDNKLPLHQYALAQLLRERPLSALLTDYKTSEDQELRQKLAGRIDTHCQSRGDTTDDWEYVLINSDPNTPLNIMAQRRLWDINARPIGQVNLESPAQFVVPHFTGLAASRPPTTSNGIALEWQTLRPVYRLEVPVPDTSGCPPTTWGVIRPVYRIATNNPERPRPRYEGNPWGDIKASYR